MALKGERRERCEAARRGGGGGASGANVTAGRRRVPVAAVPAALELVEDAVVLVQGAEFTAKVFVNLETSTSLSPAHRQHANNGQLLTVHRVQPCPPCPTGTATERGRNTSRQAAYAPDMAMQLICLLPS